MIKAPGRFESAVNASKTWKPGTSGSTPITDKDHLEKVYGENTFSVSEMRARLPEAVFNQLMATIRDGRELDPSIADTVAAAMKEWALSRGARL